MRSLYGGNDLLRRRTVAAWGREKEKEKEYIWREAKAIVMNVTLSVRQIGTSEERDNNILLSKKGKGEKMKIKIKREENEKIQ